VAVEAQTAQAVGMEAHTVGSFAHFVSIALDLWEVATVVVAVAD